VCSMGSALVGYRVTWWIRTKGSSNHARGGACQRERREVVGSAVQLEGRGYRCCTGDATGVSVLREVNRVFEGLGGKGVGGGVSGEQGKVSCKN
jgi:hypothetical protein